MARRLRSGYTTGACAAAAAKAAVLCLLGGKPETVEIPFPDGSRHGFSLHAAREAVDEQGQRLWAASIIKDAGDDPDVTNGAEIVASARFLGDDEPFPAFCVGTEDGRLAICGGDGVGRVSKPGLAVAVGEPAINPVPRRMIASAVGEALAAAESGRVQVTISVPRGRELAEKTLNRRLGIVGGLSILGTTGIVRPVSAEAWTATIEASLEVARAAGLSEVVLATGRTSEKGAQELLHLPEEAFVMMGDYLEFSLLAAARRGFRRIHLAGMWAKIMKAALKIPQTHVRHGALEVDEALALLRSLGVEQQILASLGGANTAREIHCRLLDLGLREVIRKVCLAARAYAQERAGVPVSVYLVNSKARVEEDV
ncbi:cobalt-precorrin-5B (C(1))-methyltransferase CbiD [Thiovibrio sp. JS02]